MAANKGDRAGIWAKQYREYFDAKNAGIKADFHSVESIVYELLKSKDEELKLSEIYDSIFRQQGRQYDNDSTRGAIQESLRKLCKSGKVEHTKHGHYKAI